jgi:hypothetical protein
MNQIIATIIVFYGIYHILKLVSDHFLKRKIINSGHLDKAEILGPVTLNTANPMEENRYPSLKWGLIALMSGLGFILIEVIRSTRPEMVNFRNGTLPVGIILVFVSLGFLIHFFIVSRKKENKQ